MNNSQNRTLNKRFSIFQIIIKIEEKSEREFDKNAKNKNYDKNRKRVRYDKNRKNNKFRIKDKNDKYKNKKKFKVKTYFSQKQKNEKKQRQ